MVRQTKTNFKENKNMSSGNKVKDQTVSTGGLYGSATTGKRGTSFKPSDFQTQLVGQTSSAIPQYLQQLISPTYDSQSYNNRLQQLNNAAQTSLENNIISPLSQRGLTRGSSVNQMSNQLNNKLVDAQLDLMNSEDARVNSVLSQLMNYYQVPYNMMSGLMQGSQNLYSNAQANAGDSGFGSIANSVGTLAGGGIGAYFGGPKGATAGAAIGGSLF